METVLYSFGNPGTSNDGIDPAAALIQGYDGNFYGTTYSGGSVGQGTIFEITSGGTVTIIHSFGDGTVAHDGANPAGSLFQGSDGNFYGTTINGGSTGYGTAFVVLVATAGHVPVFIGSATARGYVTVPLSFTPKAAFGVSGAAGAEGALASSVHSSGIHSLLSYLTSNSSGTDTGTTNWILTGNLPSYLSFDGTTGTITGTPTVSGIFTVTMTPQNGAGAGIPQTVTLYIDVPPSISSATTATGSVNSPFTYQIAALGNPTSFGATNLPAGFSVNQSSGAVTGTPASAGMFVFNVSATNAAGQSSQQVTVTVGNGAQTAPVINSSLTVSGTANVALNPSYQITATNSPTKFMALGLPTGMTCNTSTGVISGTTSSVGTFPVVITAANAAGSYSAVQSLTIQPISIPVISSPLSFSLTTNTYFVYQITATNSPLSYSASGLPSGLGIDATHGTITGLPPVWEHRRLRSWPLIALGRNRRR